MDDPPPPLQSPPIGGTPPETILHQPGPIRMNPRFRLCHGDLLDQPVEVIVNAWNRNFIPWWLLLPQGVSGAIKKRAGYAPFRELSRAGVLPLGGAVVTNNSAFSYFLGLDASEEDPNTLQGGDSNLELNGQRLQSTLVTLRTNATLQFDNSRHKDPPSGAGNILFGDGSVQQVTSARLRQALILPVAPINSVHRWLIP